MKKYISNIMVFYFCVILMSLLSDKSFAYVNETANIFPTGVTTINIDKYLTENNITNINYICSYEICYSPTSNNFTLEKRKLHKYISKKSSDYEKEIAYAKGYAITRINHETKTQDNSSKNTSLPTGSSSISG